MLYASVVVIVVLILVPGQGSKSSSSLGCYWNNDCDPNSLVRPKTLMELATFRDGQSVPEILLCSVANIDDSDFTLNINIGIPGAESIKFYLYTNKSSDKPSDYNEILLNDISSLKKSGFQLNAPVKILIHGYMSDALGDLTTELLKAYNKLPQPLNIVAVQWKPLAKFHTPRACYNIAAQSTRLVGRQTAKFLEFLMDNKYLPDLSSVHLLGHSLGAHAAGFVGKYHIRNQTIPRITGLDPARPLFDDVPSTHRLDSSDANFVDVIHTASQDNRILLSILGAPLGLEKAVGHVDFYPNSGTNQPGCGWIRTMDCSHSRSYKYYAESITATKDVFVAVECPDFHESNCTNPNAVKILMGEYAPFTARGVFYLKTNSASPFAQGKFILT